MEPAVFGVLGGDRKAELPPDWNIKYNTPMINLLNG
jgi:hypothetical protein